MFDTLFPLKMLMKKNVCALINFQLYLSYNRIKKVKFIVKTLRRRDIVFWLVIGVNVVAKHDE